MTILILACAVRTAPLTQNRFHPDEAWYAHFARLIASGKDPWLASVTVDKPPLPFYLNAGSLMLLAPIPRMAPVIAELATRLPSLAAGMLSVALVYRLACRLYGTGTAFVATIVFALSPLAILFSTTLFTDTLMTVFLLWSLCAAAHRAWGWSGIAVALAFSCKQTALFFIPLVLTIGFISASPLVFNASRWIKAIYLWLLPLIFAAALLFLWDMVRQPRIGFWEQGYADNNPRRFIRSNEINPRFHKLVSLTYYFTASRVASAVLLAGSLLLAATALTRRARKRSAAYDLLLVGYSVTYLATYWLLAFRLWDRYLVALVPVVSLLLARSTMHATSVKQWASGTSGRPNASPLIASLFLITMIPPALRAANSGFPIGGDHGAYDGIDEVAAVLHAVPEGSVVYDHWLSWQWSFYLFDSQTYLAWIPHPDALAADLHVHGTIGERYFVAPEWESFTEMRKAIRSAGFRAVPTLTTIGRNGDKSFTLYELVTADS